MRIHYPTFMTAEGESIEISVNPLQVRYLMAAGVNTKIFFSYDDAIMVATPLKEVRAELAIND